MDKYKLFELLLIAIICLSIANYSGYLKVEPSLLFVLMSIGMYVLFKVVSSQEQNVEGFDGSTVAFDKEAFINLNAIVAELVQTDRTTIPGNLIVKGDIICEKDVRALGKVKVGTFGKAMMVISTGRIGNEQAGQIAFDGDGWKRCFNWGTSNYNKGIASNRFWCDGLCDFTTISAKGDVICNTRITTNNLTATSIYTFSIDTDQLKGHAWGESSINILDGLTLFTRDKLHGIRMFQGGNLKGIRLQTTGIIYAHTAEVRLDKKISCTEVKTDYMYAFSIDTDVLKGHAYNANSGIINVLSGISFKHSNQRGLFVNSSGGGSLDGALMLHGGESYMSFGEVEDGNTTVVFANKDAPINAVFIRPTNRRIEYDKNPCKPGKLCR